MISDLMSISWSYHAILINNLIHIHNISLLIFSKFWCCGFELLLYMVESVNVITSGLFKFGDYFAMQISTRNNLCTNFMYLKSSTGVKISTDLDKNGGGDYAVDHDMDLYKEENQTFFDRHNSSHWKGIIWNSLFIPFCSNWLTYYYLYQHQITKSLLFVCF